MKSASQVNIWSKKMIGHEDTVRRYEHISIDTFSSEEYLYAGGTSSEVRGDPLSIP